MAEHNDQPDQGKPEQEFVYEVDGVVFTSSLKMELKRPYTSDEIATVAEHADDDGTLKKHLAQHRAGKITELFGGRVDSREQTRDE